MNIIVGVQEQHHVHFEFDKFWGNLVIAIDGQPLVGTLQMFSVSTVSAWEVVVGVQERHLVRFEKHRKVFFAGFREQPVYAFVDGVCVAQGVA